ncbi:alpha-L-rhamnosidase [Actinacidiphila alni]|uniref:Alpha-L-rhamnosidase n=1 Tax=Actinacidiphila alni TaxID=380248 RepID=A0A1I1XM70_9ACTN|nr:family 78 glycoside hydrolase catalytic domain [Actinacidiphila alni]SFE08406.1 alpha-L-rhamnosidase [Actinacidiphila alni]
MPHNEVQGPTRRVLVTTGLAAAFVAATEVGGGRAVAAEPGAGAGPDGAPAVPAGASVPAARPGGKAPSGAWDAFNLSPASRTVRPVAVYTLTGTVRDPEALVGKGHGAAKATRITGKGSSVTFDFGKEVGGFVTLSFGRDGETNQTIGLTYAELSNFVSASSSDGSNGGSNNEPAVQYAVTPGGRISTDKDTPTAGAGPTATAHPASQLRGGFRYLTVVNESGGAVDLTDVSVRITFAPNAADLSAYPNYFHCDDDLLTRVWYAGAYTVQTNIIAADQGRVWGPPDLGWDNSAKVGEVGDTVLVDGAKRDRTVWPGDLGISVLTDYVSLGDLVTVRNSLQTLYNHQAGNGALPYAGPAVNFIGNSDAYHLWTLIGTASYVQLSGDTAWARTAYDGFKKAVAYIVGKIDAADGLLSVTGSADWARGDSDGKNLEANAIMYRALVTAAGLAGTLDDDASADDWTARAAKLKSAIESGGYWDEAMGLYRDKPSGGGASLYPQDGNALAVWFGLTDSADRAAAISRALAWRWTAVGALTPEKTASSVHPFPGGMEVHAHFAAGQDATALELIRREWGYMLNAPTGTASTFWEGYRTDGTSDYSGSYMSAAHGWSTGPTSALTYRFLGIAPSGDTGSGHRVEPHPGEQRFAQGQLTTAKGVIGASWQQRGGGDFDLTVKAPSGAVDEIAVPVADPHGQVVRLDGRVVWQRSARRSGVTFSGGYVRITGVQAGTRKVSVRRH